MTSTKNASLSSGLEATSAGGQPSSGAARKRAYVPPMLQEFGSVEDFTRGTGSKMLDSTRTSLMGMLM